MSPSIRGPSGIFFPMLAKYTPSGKPGALTPIAALVLVPVAAASAWLYNLALEYIPLIYLDAVIVFAYGFGLAWLVNRTLRATKCRNKKFALAIGILVGTAAVAASHYLQFRAVQSAVIAKLGRPLTVAEYIRVRQAVGWSITHGPSSGGGGGLQISGFMVWVIWGIEALVVVLLAGQGAVTTASTPFCEPCGAWADAKDAEIRVSYPKPESLAQVTKGESVVDLLDIATVENDTKEHLVYVLQRCPSCDKLPTLTVKHNRTVEQKGKSSTKTSVLHASVLLTDAEAQTVRDLAVEGLQTAPPAEGPTAQAAAPAAAPSQT